MKGNSNFSVQLWECQQAENLLRTKNCSSYNYSSVAVAVAVVMSSLYEFWTSRRMDHIELLVSSILSSSYHLFLSLTFFHFCFYLF